MKSKSLIRTTFLVAIIAIIGKIIGFGREAITAAYFGANNSTDAYFLARNMPALLFPAVCNSMATAFLSVYITKENKEGQLESDIFASKALTITVVVSILLSIFAFVITPTIVPIIVPGFDGETTNLAIQLTRISMTAFILYMLQFMLTAVLNSKKNFYGAQFAGVLNGLFIILVTFLFAKNQKIQFLMWTTIGGLIVQLLVLIIFVKRKFVFSLFNNNWFSADIRNMLNLSIPILIGNSIVQLSEIVDKVLASNLAPGSVSALTYSASLNSIVTSVFIVSVSTVLYPTLVENASRNNQKDFSINLTQNILFLILIIVPISIITFIYSRDIISIVYFRGKFDQAATNLTTTALTYYSLGYIFIGIREVVNRGFYAMGDSKTPMKNGLFSVSLNIIMSIILTKYMGIGGIAIGTSISAAISALILIKSMNKKGLYIKLSELTFTLIKILIASLITSLILNSLSSALIDYTPLIRFTLATIIGGISYITILVFLKCKEILTIFKSVDKWVSKN